MKSQEFSILIVSHAHKFVFMHNPKVGGTSIRHTMERFNDATTRFYGTDPDNNSVTHRVDRAHMGIDEFANLYPSDWASAQDYKFFALWRAPDERILSSTNEYSRRFAKTDLRFLDPEKRRDFLFRTLEKLETLGTADDIMDQLKFTHFRPQWIYTRSRTGGPVAMTFALKDISQLFAAIGTIVGEPALGLDTSANSSEQISMPGPIGHLLAQRRLRTMLTEAPVISKMTPLIRKMLLKLQKQQSSRDSFALSPEDQAAVALFAKSFYKRDYELLPINQ